MARVEKHLACDPDGVLLKRGTHTLECDLVPRVRPKVRDHLGGDRVALVSIRLAASKHDVDVVSFLTCQMTIDALATSWLGLKKECHETDVGSLANVESIGILRQVLKDRAVRRQRLGMSNVLIAE